MPNKLFYFTLLICLFLAPNSYCEVNSENNSSYQSHNVNSQGLGIAIVKKLELISGLALFDKSDDSIFIMPEIFYENFLNSSSLINEQYGFGFNLGYSYNDFDILASIGGLRAGFDYKIDNQVENYHKGAIYYSLGLAYNFNQFLATKISAKFYEISFTDRNSDRFHSRNNSVALLLVLKI